MPMKDVRRWMLAVCVATLPLASAGVARGQGAWIAVSPETVRVTPPDTTFTVELRVPVAGAAFNAFDAVVEYDTTALTFVPVPQNQLYLQEGTLMKNACPNRFHRFSAAGDSLTITDGLLCSGASVTGPGQLYVLRFRSSSTPRLTYIRLRRAKFFDAGLFVKPVHTSNALVAVGVTLGADPAPPARPGLQLRAVPNPGRGGTSLWFEAPPGSSPDIRVLDVSGRTVRRFTVSGGAGHATWDGRDDAGHRLPPGVYHAVLRAGDEARMTRVVLIQ